jgi:hypothetical protein
VVCNGDVCRCCYVLSVVGDVTDNTYDGVAACSTNLLPKQLLSIPTTISRQVQKPKVKMFCESSLSFSLCKGVIDWKRKPFSFRKDVWLNRFTWRH